MLFPFTLFKIHVIVSLFVCFSLILFPDISFKKNQNALKVTVVYLFNSFNLGIIAEKKLSTNSSI